MTTISLQWVLNFANAIVGVGLLTMPYCFQQCGIVLATLMILGSGYLTKTTCEFLLRAGSYTRKSSYEQLALLVYGPTGKLLCELSTIGVSVGTLVAFQVVIGDLAPAIVTGTLGFGSSWMLRAVLMIASCGLVLPLCLMRSVSSLANLNTVSMTFYSCFIFVVCCLSLPSLSALEWWTDVAFWKPAAFFKCLPIILLSYNCQAQVFIFYGALPDPNIKTMIAIIHKAINLVNFFYCTVGMFGYIAFYKAGVHGDVLENFPPGFLTILMKLGFLLSVIVSFPLMCFPVRSSLNSLLFADKKQGILHDVITNSAGYIAPDKFVIITLGLVSSTLVIGILVPKIEVVLSITGALAGSFICLVFPSALFVMTGGKDKLRGFGLTVLLVSSVFLIACTSTSIMGLLSGEPPPVATADVQQEIVNNVIKKSIQTEPPVTIAELAEKLVPKEKFDVKNIPDNLPETHNIPELLKVDTTHPPSQTTLKVETKAALPEIIKVEEKTQPPTEVKTSNEKQINELNDALHGKSKEAAGPTEPPLTTRPIAELKKAVLEEIAASGLPAAGKLIVADSEKKHEVINPVKQPLADKKDVAVDSHDTNKVLDITNNSLPLKETPLEVSSVKTINESDIKPKKVSREILSNKA